MTWYFSNKHYILKIRLTNSARTFRISSQFSFRNKFYQWGRVFRSAWNKVSTVGDNDMLQFAGHIWQYFLSVAISWKFLKLKLFIQGSNILTVIGRAKLFMIFKSSVIKTWIFSWCFAMSTFWPSISANELTPSSKITLSERSCIFFNMLLDVLGQNIQIIKLSLFKYYATFNFWKSQNLLESYQIASNN